MITSYSLVKSIYFVEVAIAHTKKNSHMSSHSLQFFLVVLISLLIFLIELFCFCFFFVVVALCSGIVFQKENIFFIKIDAQLMK